MEKECFLCLELNDNVDNFINIYEDEWKEQNIESIIEQHLWSMSSLKSNSSWLCITCWSAINEFHQFYKGIENVQTYYKHVYTSDHVENDESDLLQNFEVVSYIDESENVTLCDAPSLLDEIQDEYIENNSHNGPLSPTDETMDSSPKTDAFKCRKSSKILKDENSLERHMTWHDNKLCNENDSDNDSVSPKEDNIDSTPYIDTFECLDCNEMLKDETALKEHLAWHESRHLLENDSYNCSNSPSDETIDSSAKTDTFMCLKCLKLLKDESTFKWHIAWHEGNLFSCEICDLKFIDSTNLIQHKLIHAPSEKRKNVCGTYIPEETQSSNNTFPSDDQDVIDKQQQKISYECKYCSKLLENELMVAKHKAWHTGNVYSCKICFLKFVDSERYKSHKIMHKSNRAILHVSKAEFKEELENDLHSSKGSEEFKCPYCGTEFFHKAKYLKHIAEHEQQNVIEKKENTADLEKNLDEVCSNEDATTFRCQFCCRDLDNRRSLLRHIALHEGNIYHCNECELRFFNETAFEKHQLAHENAPSEPDSQDGETDQQDDLECKNCSKVLSSRRVYAKHNAWHKGTIYRCEICDMKFLDKCSFDGHTESHMPKSWKRCRECRKPFSCATEVVLHYKKMHCNAFQNVCDVCGLSYRCPLSFKRHVEKHKGNIAPKLPCNICGRLLASKNTLKYHMKINHPEGGVLPYVCDICMKPLATRSMLKTHIRLYHKTTGYDKNCSICGKRFKNYRAYKNHAEIHSAEKKYACKWCPEKFYLSDVLSRHKKKVHPTEYAEWKKQQYVEV